VFPDHLPGDEGKRAASFCRGLIASLLREKDVAADVGDQERPQRKLA
jgi:hypothetical protein